MGICPSTTICHFFQRCLVSLWSCCSMATSLPFCLFSHRKHCLTLFLFLFVLFCTVCLSLLSVFVCDLYLSIFIIMPQVRSSNFRYCYSSRQRPGVFILTAWFIAYKSDRLLTMYVYTPLVVWLKARQIPPYI